MFRCRFFASLFKLPKNWNGNEKKPVPAKPAGPVSPVPAKPTGPVSPVPAKPTPAKPTPPAKPAVPASKAGCPKEATECFTTKDGVKYA